MIQSLKSAMGCTFCAVMHGCILCARQCSAFWGGWWSAFAHLCGAGWGEIWDRTPRFEFEWDEFSVVSELQVYELDFFLVLYPIIKACFTRCLLLKRNESTTELHASLNCSCKPGTDNIRGGSRQRLFILLMWHYKRFVLWGVLGTSGRNHQGFPGNLFSSWLQSRLYAHDTEEL